LIQLRRLCGDELLEHRHVQVESHRKVMKAEPSRLIPRKLATNLAIIICN